MKNIRATQNMNLFIAKVDANSSLTDYIKRWNTIVERFSCLIIFEKVQDDEPVNIQEILMEENSTVDKAQGGTIPQVTKLIF